MGAENLQYSSRGKPVFFIRRLHSLLAPRAYSVIMFGSLFCTLAVKFFHSWRIGLVNEYFGWILADISVLLGIEVVLAAVCFCLPRRWVIRAACIVAAVVCTWSVMNAGWLIRTGTQILPTVLLPLFRDPLNGLGIIGVNLAKMPAAAVILLGPSAIALAFFFFVLAKPLPPDYNHKHFFNKILISCIFIFIAVIALALGGKQGSAQIASEGLRYNCQLRAVACFLLSDSSRRAKADIANARRKIPAFDQIGIALSPKLQRTDQNVVIVVLEGIQYSYTSLADKQSNLTPFLAALAQRGAEFTNARSSLTHTTKVLFSLLTGRSSSASHDIAEAVPAVKPYAGIATILKDQLNFRTAFFQSAKGNFEGRPGLVYNLGFDKFWARDDLNDPNAFLGYLASDEFSMLKPITEWIKAYEKPFFLTVLCSVTHDPYEVPEWFATPSKESLERYRQAISYTDKFIAALDVELAKLGLRDKTIFCVIGDHGEAFGEHGLLGHERIVFEEVLRIPFCLRAPLLIRPGTRITKPVGSIDLTPTLLALFGFDTKAADFDGVNALGHIPDDRKVYFSGWLRQSPAGFVKANRKFIYNPANKMVSVYDLSTDSLESIRIELPEQQAQMIADEIITWRKNSIFRLDQQRTGKKTLFGSWLCRWTNRVSSVRYRPK
ncbi:MAG: LTA synthase family protein [Planctomycetota bacterium]|jgi:phosphoglycerol transferase MdoB-like AlkP superfamily enzyme